MDSSTTSHTSEEKRFKNICVVSCILGTKFRKVHPAPTCCDCYFFTNNPQLKSEVEEKGWIYQECDMQLSNDLVTSSNQAKWVKFLQFLKFPKYDALKGYEMILYTDHKMNLLDENVDQLLRIKTKSIVVKKHPYLETIWDELREAKYQERYKVFEAVTRRYILDKFVDGYTDETHVCHTAVILYQITDPRVINFVSEMYCDMRLIGTPECQIVWCIVSQKYEDTIQVIERTDVPVKYILP